MTTVREMVMAIQVEVRDTPDLVPIRASQLLMHATALIGNVNAEIRDADAKYNLVLLDCLKTEEKANRAKIVAETTPAYARRREARDTLTLLEALIGSLKIFIRAQTEEMKLAR